MNKAVFLDRDGVINQNRDDYVKSLEELHIFPFVATLIQKLHELNFLVIVITNQSVINRGLISREKLNEIHNAIQDYMVKNNTSIDAFYYCPHRPDENCKCRKPNPGLIKQAAIDFQINLSQSWMIGDNQKDFDAGISAGCKSIKLSHPSELENILDKIFSN